jgi:C_GCAxxG_C_C family probable redox protein
MVACLSGHAEENSAMTDRVEKTIDAFDSDTCNCCQAIARVFGPEVGLDEKSAVRAGCAFSGGIGRSGKVCGAVTGAVLVLGFKANEDEADTQKAMEDSIDLVDTFMTRFTESHGSLDCKDLLGLDLSTEEGRRINDEDHVSAITCPAFVRTAAQILDDMM